MDYYAINKVLQQPDISDIKLETVSVFSKLYEAEDFISNMTRLTLFSTPDDNTQSSKTNETIVGFIDNKPNDENMDGFYLVKDNDNKRKYFIYQKKTEISRGYIYNSIDIKIVKHGFFEISHIRVEKGDTINKIELVNNNMNKKTKIDQIQVDLNNKLIEEFKKTLGNNLRKVKNKLE